MENVDKPLSMWQLANALGIPPKWIRAKAMAGRIPHLKIGKKLFFNRAAVEAEINTRASQAVARG